MMRIALSRLFIMFVLTGAGAPLSVAQKSSWTPPERFRGIIPFVTTREQVEKKLGKPNGYGRYELDEGRVYVLYHETKCEKSNRICFCLAPLETVLVVDLELYYHLKIGDLALDPKIWESNVIEGCVPGFTAYSNHRTGITYTVQNGIVRDVTYRESEETCKMLSR